MTEYSRGDVVLVSFIFTDETGVKQRPAVIISSDVYHQQRQENKMVQTMMEGEEYVESVA